jgi:hypothetical protein
MALRTGHGTGAGQPRIEVLPPDELPIGVAGRELEESSTERSERGLFLAGSTTAQSKGGRARAGQTRLARRLGLADMTASEEFKPYKKAGADFRRCQVASLARTVGGGICGPAAASMVATAAWQLAASRYLFDLAAALAGTLRDEVEGTNGAISIQSSEFMTLASKLGNDSRQNLLAAHELCAREAESRRRAERDETRMSLAFALEARNEPKG